MRRVAEALDRVGRRSVVVDRPGYGSTLGVAGVVEQAAWLADTCASIAPTVDLIRVSGGATVGLAAACARPEVFGRVVLHEPLVGPLAPDLHDAIVSSAATLAADPSVDALIAFVRRLVGTETMDHLGADLVDGLVRSAAAVRREVPAFAAFAPSIDELSSLAASGVDVVTTLGVVREPAIRRDAEARSAAADVLAHFAAASVVELPTCGHLAQVDDPDALADALGRADVVVCAP